MQFLRGFTFDRPGIIDSYYVVFRNNFGIEGIEILVSPLVEVNLDKFIIPFSDLSYQF